MSYKNHLQFIKTYADQNVICDGDICLSYSDLTELMSDIDKLFSNDNKNSIYCLGVNVENSIRHAMIILYLLSEKINFYLISSSLSSNKNVPNFCDKIISVDKNEKSGVFSKNNYTICDNPNFNGEEMDIRPGQACVLFSSSGSSGKPKYICYSQHNLIQNAENCLNRFQINSYSNILVSVPIGHMFGLGVGLLPGLLSGASFYLIEKNNIVKFLSARQKFNASHTLLTPSLVNMILLLKKQGSYNGVFITAGERINHRTYVLFEQNYGTLLNLYGCTELGAVGVASEKEIDKEERAAGFVRPLPNVEIKVSQDQNGEILCKHNAGFVSYVDENGILIHASRPKNIWYETNDIGFYDPTKGLKVIGRKDNCINRLGFLISLDEVENLLKENFSQIIEAIVFESIADNAITTKIVAVCQVDENCDININELKKKCSLLINKHYIPDDIYLIKSMPRLDSGKPDRNFLITKYKSNHFKIKR